jgi:Tol biopolymer transport system component
MGEVYRARDPKLQRDVAIKALPPEFASDPDRVARFEREAQALAALNHPGIAGIHELLEHDGARFLVLEYVEGDTLAARVARGPVPIDDALPIAQQLAEALEAAHDKNIVHRDLKPANIIVRPDGTVKVLDFGLAKALEPAGAASAVMSQSPTMISMTAGIIVGTAAYMSPEQARGKAVDRRADVWAFGCVLYEMVTGTQAFAGETVTDVISAVMRAEPDWSRLPADTPPAVHRLLRRCLVKDVRERLPHIGVARLDLREASVMPPTAASAAMPKRRSSVLLWIALVTTATVAAALGAALMLRRDPPSLGAVRFDIDTPDGTVRLGHFIGLRGPGVPAPHFAISPDGRMLALAAVEADNSVHLWVRSLSSSAARRLPGTADASFPFWSPDSRVIAFFAGGQLKTIALDAEAPITLCPVDNGEGGTWSREGTILFAPRRSGIWRVSARGGTPAEVTTKPSNAAAYHSWPAFLPDGQSFVYYAFGDADQQAVRIRALASGDDTELVKTSSRAVVAAGHVLFLRDGQLMAQPLDGRTRALTGEPRVLVGSVAFNAAGGRAAFHASDAGVLVYRSGAELERSRMTWWSRAGVELSVVDRGQGFGAVVLSPDGSRAVVQINDNSDAGRMTADLWTYEFSTGIRARFTTEPGYEWAPAWSPDGQTIAYSVSPSLTTANSTATSIWLKPAGGSQPARKFADGAGVVSSWTRDGSGLLVTAGGEKTFNDVWLVPLSGATRQGLVQTAFDDRDAHVSPDGRWLAYLSNENGQFDVYIQQFPAGKRSRVSPNGGTSPHWSKDAGELFYSYQGNVYVAKMSANGASAPTLLLRDAVDSNPSRGTGRRFAVSPDGQRLLTVTLQAGPRDTPISVVVNWPELLRQ